MPGHIPLGLAITGRAQLCVPPPPTAQASHYHASPGPVQVSPADVYGRQLARRGRGRRCPVPFFRVGRGGDGDVQLVGWAGRQ